MIKRLFLLITAVVVSGQLQAGVIPGVTVAAVSSEYVSSTDQRRATNLLGGIGLFGDIHTTIAQGDMWLTLPTTALAFTNAFVTFDLGAIHTTARMKIWNYNEFAANAATNRGVQFMSVSYSTDNVTFTTNLPNLLLNRAPLAFTNFGQTIDLAAIQARYIRFNVLTNYGPGENRVGLSKVQFVDDTVIPTVKIASESISGDRVTVQFTESVQAATATNATNYIVQSGATTVVVSNATVNLYNDTVTLKTATLDSNLVYTVSVQNVRDLADHVTFDSAPVTIEKEFTLWLKADAGVTADGSGFVSQWNDQSGFGNNAVQATPLNQPTLVPNAVNGNPVIHFDGTTNLLEVANTPSSKTLRDFTLYAVLSTDNLVPVAAAQSPISRCPANVPGTFDLQIIKTTGKLRLLRGNGSGSASFDSSAAIAANQYYLISYVVRDTNATTYLNGNYNGVGNIVTGLGDSGTPIRIGARADWATRFGGNLAELMVVRGAISDTEKNTIDSYLGAKYGISVITLQITEQPQAVTAQLGKTATFWVNAIASSPTINYQWQSNSVNIVGATNSVYTTPTLTLAANGAAYSAIASTPLGISTNSSAATLTVVADTQAPTIFSATKKAGSSTDIVVVYSEAMTPATATNVSNYSLNNGVTISSAVMGGAPNQVVLTTSGLNAATSYQLTVQNAQDLFANTITPTTVMIFPSNMSLWLRADSSVITNDSGLVNQWLDQTSNTNNTSQFAGPSFRPTFLSSSINNQPALTFNGSNYLQAASTPSLAITGDISLYVVTRIATLPTSGYSHFIGKTAANIPASYDYYVQNGANGTLYRGNGIVSARVLETALPSSGTQHVMNVVMSGTNVSHFLDGVANGTGTLSTTVADAGRPLRIGSRDALDVFMNGEIAEVMIFNAALSTTDRKAIDSYLGFKYFPFSITQQPQNASQLEGEIATFSIVASAGSATFTYQWQKNGVNIGGATNASYTTPTLTQADNGSTYQVSVIPLIGTPILSDTATLSVSADTVSPTVVSAGLKIWNTNQIVVTFSEAVSLPSATNLVNYSINGGATITSAVVGVTSNRVVLTVIGLDPTIAYTLTIQNVYDLFGNVMSPANVPNGVYPPSAVLWLKADAGVAVDGNNFVTGWTDQSGNGNNAFPDVSGAPLFVASTPGGQPGVNFNGTNQYLVVNNSPTVALTSNMAVYVVAQIKDFTSTSNEIGFISKAGNLPAGNLPASFDFYLAKTTRFLMFYRGDGTVNGYIIGTNRPTLGASHLFAALMDGQNAFNYLDGQLNGSGLITVPLADAGNPLIIGTRMDFRPWMNGNIQEILLFGAALSDADRLSLDGYVETKYRILSGPVPRISTAPGVENTVVLTWPTPNLTFALETVSTLGSSWATATNVVTANTNGTSSAVINTAVGNQFYRLHQQ